MSEALEKLKQKHAQFVSQRDQIQNQYHQLVGACGACEIMIKEEEAKIAEESKGDTANEQVAN